MKEDKQLTKQLDILSKSLLVLTSEQDIKSLLLDLCTPTEIDAMAGRLAVVNLLKDNIPYRKIHGLTGVSLATITRVARTLKYGQGGYNLVYDNLQSS